MSGEPTPGPEPNARDRILQAACALIAERGIGGARIAQIAKAAGVSTALVHYHFRTRETLLSETLDYAFDLAAAVRLRAAGENGSAGSAARRLADVVEQSLPTTDPGRREWQLWAELWLGAARDPGLRPIAAQMYARYRTWIAAPWCGPATGWKRWRPPAPWMDSRSSDRCPSRPTWSMRSGRTARHRRHSPSMACLMRSRDARWLTN